MRAFAHAPPIARKRLFHRLIRVIRLIGCDWSNRDLTVLKCDSLSIPHLASQVPSPSLESELVLSDMSFSEPSSDTHDNTSVVSGSSISASDEPYVYHEGFPHNFFESDDGTYFEQDVALMRRKGIDPVLIDTLQHLHDAAYGSISTTENLKAERREQIVFFNAKIDHLMANRDSLEDQKARHLLNVGRGIIVRAFQVLFPVAYCDGEVYYPSESDGRKRAVDWISFRSLVQAHCVLLENKVLPRGSRLAKRQDVILREHSAVDDLCLAKRPRSPFKSAIRTKANNGNAHMKENLLFFLPLLKAKFALIKRDFEKAEQDAIKYCSTDARDKGSTPNDYWTLLPDTIRRVEGELQELRDMLERMEKSASIANEASRALPDMPNIEENQRTRSVSDAKPTFPSSVNGSDADNRASVDQTKLAIATVMSYLDMIRHTKRTLETLESKYFYIGAAIQIMENDDLLGLILDIFYGLVIPPNGLMILENSDVRARRADESFGMEDDKRTHHQALQLLRAIVHSRDTETLKNAGSDSSSAGPSAVPSQTSSSRASHGKGHYDTSTSTASTQLGPVSPTAASSSGCHASSETPAS